MEDSEENVYVDIGAERVKRIFYTVIYSLRRYKIWTEDLVV